MDSTDLATLMTLHMLLQEVSVTRAAKKLNLSTPAVSHALAKLRERFDDPLLVRAGRAMVLTPRAQALKPLVRAAIESASAVFEPQGAFAPESLACTWTISASDYVLNVFGEQLDEHLMRAAPGVNLRFIPNAIDDPMRLREQATDLAIGIYGQLPQELKMRPIITDRLVCVVRQGHPLVNAQLSLAQYVALQHIQIAPRGRPGGYLDDVLAEQGLTRRVVRAVPYFQVAMAMAARTDHILTVSERIARKLGPALGLKIVELPMVTEPFALSMVWHPRFDADLAHKWLREQLLLVTSQLGGIAHDKPRRHLSSTDPTAG